MIPMLLRVLFWLILLSGAAAIIWRALRKPGPAGYFPAAAVVVSVLWLTVAAMTPGEQEEHFNLYEFGTLPVQDGGRTKPLDTFARMFLMQSSDRQSYVDEKGDSQPAIKIVLDLMFQSPKVVGEYPIFRVTNAELLDMLGVEARTGFRYSIGELLAREGNNKRLLDEFSAARERGKDDRSQRDRAVLELMEHIETFQAIAALRTPRFVRSEQDPENWEELAALFPDGLKAADSDTLATRPEVRALGSILETYAAGDPKKFNAAVASYKEMLPTAGVAEKDVKRIELESFFNHLEPFFVCSVLYVCVFLLAILGLLANLGWLSWAEPLNQSAFWLGVMTLAVHTWALFTRMILMDRPMVFVTNLYGTAIFIGWATVMLCLVLERLYRNGIGNVLAAVLGSLTLLVAHNLATGDTLEMLTAVLDTNFWLSTHVTCVTFGYAATFVAGFIGLAFIVLGVLTTSLRGANVKVVGQMLYGILCFALFLSFVGTVLGGIWADQSWGRFWGWDPKENGAMLIVIWNALILHARWAGMVQQRGMAVLAVAGNIITAWSWFGTNMLGVGLHSYGKIDEQLFWLLTFIFSQIAVILVGVLPLSMWSSFNAKAEVPPFVPPTVDSPKKIKGKKGVGNIQPA